MEKKEEFQVFPWSTNHEFRSVSSIVMNLNFNSKLLYNLDFLKDLQWAERQLTIWRTKTSSAQHLYEIDATHSILNCLLHEYLAKLSKMRTQSTESDQSSGLNEPAVDQQTNDFNDSRTVNDLSTNQLNALNTDHSSIFNSPSFNLINEETVAVLYSNAILKFFKMLSHYDVINGKVERLLSRSEANLVRVCERLDFPKYIIEFRHRIAHNKLPSFKQLKFAAQTALNWMKQNYWSKYMRLLDDQEKSRIQIYEQTKILLNGLFEVKEDVDVQLNRLNALEKLNKNDKRSKRPLKKQKVELKKFSVLDRSQISLLHDTLYDLLTEDFYTALHAITLYIVDSTKEHLGEISVEQIKKWIQDDEMNMQAILANQQSNERQINKKTNLNIKEKKKREQLIPMHILTSFRPIFEIITKQISSINQLLLYLYSIIVDQKIDQKLSALIWFIQIICSLVNNLNYSTMSAQDKQRINNPLIEFEKCFALTEIQLTDLKWIHLFTKLVEEPELDKLNLCIVKRFYPLVSFRYSKVQFNQIYELLSIYLDVNDGDRKKESIKTNPGNTDYFDLEQLESLPETNGSSNNIDWSRTKLGFI